MFETNIGKTDNVVNKRHRRQHQGKGIHQKTNGSASSPSRTLWSSSLASTNKVRCWHQSVQRPLLGDDPQSEQQEIQFKKVLLIEVKYNKRIDSHQQRSNSRRSSRWLPSASIKRTHVIPWSTLRTTSTRKSMINVVDNVNKRKPWSTLRTTSTKIIHSQHWGQHRQNSMNQHWEQHRCEDSMTSIEENNNIEKNDNNEKNNETLKILRSMTTRRSMTTKSTKKTKSNHDTDNTDNDEKNIGIKT